LRSTRPRATPAAGCVPPGYRPGRAAGRTRAGLGLPVRVGPARHSVRPSEYDSPRRRSMGSRGPRPARIDCPCPGLERRLPTLGMGTERPVASSPSRWLKFGPVHLAGPAGLGRAVGRPVRIRVRPRAAVRIRPGCHDLCLAPCPQGSAPGSARPAPPDEARCLQPSSVPLAHGPSVPGQFPQGPRAVSSPAATSVSSLTPSESVPPGHTGHQFPSRAVRQFPPRHPSQSPGPTGRQYPAAEGRKSES
jgi:hypothetical protein